MANRDGGTGGTGFLFGNIDKRGRLDEDYLDEETKNNIDHVGGKVDNNDKQLREIESMPLKKGTVSDEDDNYDADEDPQKQDYFDIDDPDELDENTRNDMNALSTQAKPVIDEDENYDDDDDDDDGPAEELPAQKKGTTALQTAPADGSASRKTIATSSVQRKRLSYEQAALEEQKRLMKAAREATNRPIMRIDSAAAEEEEVDPLPFTKVFFKPPPPLRFIPAQKRYGIVREPQPVQLAPDEGKKLESAPSMPEVDPVDFVLALDKKNVLQRKGVKNRAEIVPVYTEEYDDAARPLGDQLVIEPVNETHCLVQQVDWESDIKWGEPNEDEDDEWTKEAVCEKPDAHMRDSDDDDDEFEDPVQLNVKEGAKEAGAESDDDVEWEDGGLLANDSKAAKAESMKTADPMDVDAAATQTSNTGNGATEDAKAKGNKSPSATEVKTSGGPKIEEQCTEKSDVKELSLVVAPKNLIESIPPQNTDLCDGNWVHGIAWDSQSDTDPDDASSSSSQPLKIAGVREKLARLILDLNDENMSFEQVIDDFVNESRNMQDGKKVLDVKGLSRDLLQTTGTRLQQLLEADRFNISNDLYYASGSSTHQRIDRRSILRGLQNAPPAVKCQTTHWSLSAQSLLSFRRPKLYADDLPNKMILQPFRRKRPKAGKAQIAGQVPKKLSELQCSVKDAYRVSLFEYALERQPSVLPIPGMASRVVTFARKISAAEAAQASKNAAGTAEADTVFLAPDEPPPVSAGDLDADGKPLSVIESHVYSAPCVKTVTPTTDFLLVRSENEMFVREIDSVVSVGVTEPKIEVMAPNTERYKKFAKDRVSLWVMREAARQRKDFLKLQKKQQKEDGGLLDPREELQPYIEKEQIFRAFPRRRTYPETSLLKLLREMSKNQNGKYVISEEFTKIAPTREAKEAELLRTLTPQETAAYESMEAGWEHLLDIGVQTFTFPSGQGNILAASEKTGHEAGTAVATFLKCHLFKSPWYQSQSLIAAQRAQRKDLLQVLSLARIVNDLKEGGTSMESRLMTLSAAELNHVLTNHYRLNQKKIPGNVEERRALIREMVQRKQKSNVQDLSDYSNVIRTVLKKHRDAGLAKGASIAATGTTMSNGTMLGIPLDIQRRALEDGDVEELPVEANDYFPEKDGKEIYAAARKVFGERAKKEALKKEKTASTATPTNAGNSGSKHIGGSHPGGELSITVALTLTPHATSKKGAEPADDPHRKLKKKVTRLKVTKKVTGPDGKQKSVVTYITDPEEIKRRLEKRGAPKKNKKESGTGGGGGGKSNEKLKIAIGLRDLQGGIKKGKKKTTPGDKKKSSKKQSGSTAQPSIDKPIQKISGEKKGQIGKIKISTKQIIKQKEQAALKRKRSQYGDDIVDYRAKKTAKTSRRKRNGTVQLNGIIEQIEDVVRHTDGYIVPGAKPMRIARLHDGESPPPGVMAKNIAVPKGTGLDLTAPVDAKTVPLYSQIVKNPMYLDLIRRKCKNMKYETADQYLADMNLVVSNARLFNKRADVQWVVQHAELLLEVAKEELQKRSEDIKAAEEMVKIEKAEAKASGASSKAKKKKKASVNSKKAAGKSNDVVEIQDNSDDVVEVKKNTKVDVIILEEPQGGSKHADADADEP
ncbi:unnamed protein product [Agarophyton chilense]|eukprot:gb/GEZJ01001448.1/.p1 GENE.gb/GEZJ01001448.1/~~gb/GEZJ01001448.1/.p1  ORF type:complete len:1621 (-),score=386.63 gb/GEZJ01001448.1/:3429-8291(-)